MTTPTPNGSFVGDAAAIANMNNVLTHEERRTWRQTAVAGRAFAQSALKNVLNKGTRSFKAVDDPSVPQPVRAKPPTRSESVAQLLEATAPSKALDVLVIGGGATGTAIALDLATRSAFAAASRRTANTDAATTTLSIGLVEANDYASETSSRSSKLIHGGVRYLEKAVFGLDYQQLKLVFEALSERAIVAHQAPFLVHPIETIIPCYSLYDVVMFWAGMKTYDLLAVLGGGVVGGFSAYHFPAVTQRVYSHLLAKRSALKKTQKGDGANNAAAAAAAPSSSSSSPKCLCGRVFGLFRRIIAPFVALSLVAFRLLTAFPSFLIGSIFYYDGQHHDARLCLHVALTAGTYGAACVNHCKLIGIEEDDTSGRRLHKCTIVDAISKTTHVIYARAIVNATGPFSDAVRRIVNPYHTNKVKPSHGTHITLPQRYAPKDRAMLIPSNDGRVIFCISYLGHCIAGTTDAISAVEESPQAPEKDVEFILDNLRIHLGPIERSEVLSVWCGIRPLAAPESASVNAASSQSIVREHSIHVDEGRRVLSITGGKWTTYRKMAHDAVVTLVDKELIPEGAFAVGGGHSTSSAAAAPSSAVGMASLTEDLVLYGARELDSLSTRYYAGAANATRRLPSPPSKFAAPYWAAAHAIAASSEYGDNKIPALVVLHWIQVYGDGALTLCGIAHEVAAREEVGEAALRGDAVDAYWRNSRILASSSSSSAAGGSGSSSGSILTTDIDVIYSCRFESCERIQDFIARRSPMAFLNKAVAEGVVGRVADVMAAELKWSAERKASELFDAAQYLKTFEAKP